MKLISLFVLPALLTLPFSSFARAEDAPTQGPNAKLYKLPDRWVSVLPTTPEDEAAAKAKLEASEKAKAEEAAKAKSMADAAAAAPVIAAAPIVAPAPSAPSAATASKNVQGLPGYTPDANYSGACHITVHLDNKTYIVNRSSSTDMVLSAPANSVCLPTEKLAIRYGFKKTAR